MLDFNSLKGDERMRLINYVKAHQPDMVTNAIANFMTTVRDDDLRRLIELAQGTEIEVNAFDALSEEDKDRLRNDILDYQPISNDYSEGLAVLDPWLRQQSATWIADKLAAIKA